MTPENLQAIEAAAVAMIGSPERRCQIAMADCYKAAGLLPKELEIPHGNYDWARSQGRSLITPWVEGCGFFVEAEAPAQPGDLLGFRLGHVLHHVAIQLDGGRMFHVFGDHGPQIAVAIPDQWAKRLEKIWRLR